MSNQPPDVVPARSAVASSSKVAKSKFVNVYNDTPGILDVNVVLDPPGKNGQVLRNIQFFPTNNRISREDLEVCKKNETFNQWASERTALTVDGHPYPHKMLSIGVKKDHDQALAKVGAMIQKAREDQPDFE